MRIQIIALLLFVSLSFCWQTSLPENIKGISLIDDNKALIYGDKTAFVLDTGSGTFVSYDMMASMTSHPVYNPDMNTIVAPSNATLVAYNTLKKTRAETKMKDPAFDICSGSQGMFYVLTRKGEDYSVNAMRLEVNGSLSQANVVTYKSPIRECASVGSYPYALILTGSEIIIYRDSEGKDTASVPMKAVSSNIIYTEGKFYAASTGGLLASFDQNGRIFNTTSVSDNIMAIIAGNDGIIAYGSSGKVYLFSKDLSLSSVSQIQAGVPLGIYKSGGGYAVLMSTRLVTLDSSLNPTGDFAFDKVQDNSVFARNQLITAGGSMVDSSAFTSGCTILSPQGYSEVGYMPFRVTGRAFSYVSDFYVDVKVNDEPWTRAAGSGDWSIEIRPMEYPFGKMTIRCKTSEQSDSKLSSVVYLDRVSTLPKNRFAVQEPPKMEAGESYTISVLDSFNSSVSNFNVSINGEKPKAISSGKFSFSPSAPGDYTLNLSKDGFDDGVYVISVGGIPFLLLVIGIILVLLIAAYLYFSFKK